MASRKSGVSRRSGYVPARAAGLAGTWLRGDRHPPVLRVYTLPRMQGVASCDAGSMLPDAACAMFGESVGRLTSRCNQHVVAPGRAPVYGGHQMAVPGPADHLRKVAIFKGLDAADLDRLTQACRRRKYRDHEALFHEGDPGYTLYVILSGHVSVQRINDTGQVVPDRSARPGRVYRRAFAARWQATLRGRGDNRAVRATGAG